MARPRLDSPDAINNAQLILHRVGRHHFAFLKGYLEGLEIRALGERYLETCSDDEFDLRVIKSTLTWIRTELKLVAKRFGKASYARAIMLNPEQLKTVKSNVPSLEEFREERDPYEMYSEEDLIELFQEAYPDQGNDKKYDRNTRLRKRQTDALSWLQEMAISDPTLKDNVAAWLKPVFSKKLIRAGVNTIEELIEAINSYGYRWYSQVPSLGEKSAKHIVKWLTINEEVLSCSLEKYSLSKRSTLDIDTLKKERPKTTNIVPLEYFLPNKNLDGSVGTNRGERNKSGVDNDYDAIQLWLRTFPKDSNTYLAYRSQAERFLLWCVLERGKPISSLDTIDTIAYRDFLWDLGRMSPETWNTVYKIPESSWLGKRNTERWSPNWRPFEELKPPKPPKDIPKLQRKTWIEEHTFRTGVLKLSSQRQAQTILSSMCSWLVKRRYLDSNPWDGVKPRLSNTPVIATDHSFTFAQWDFIMNAVEAMPKTGQTYRLKFILILGYLTGMRLSEMASAVKGDLRFRAANVTNQSGWTISVIGKRNKQRDVPFPHMLMEAFKEYLAHRGFTTFDEVPQDCPLIDFLSDARENLLKQNNVRKKRKDNALISPSQIYRSLKKFFDTVSDNYEAISPEEAAHIRLASTHWLRHTCGSHAVANEVPIEVVQQNFGHASVGTTSIYITPEIERRMSAMEQFANSKKQSR